MKEGFEELYDFTLEQIYAVIDKEKDFIDCHDFYCEVRDFEDGEENYILEEIFRFYKEYELYELTPIEVFILIKLYSDFDSAGWLSGGVYFGNCLDCINIQYKGIEPLKRGDDVEISYKANVLK